MTGFPLTVMPTPNGTSGVARRRTFGVRVTPDDRVPDHDPGSARLRQAVDAADRRDVADGPTAPDEIGWGPVALEGLGVLALFLLVQVVLTAGTLVHSNPLVGFVAVAAGGWGLSELLRRRDHLRVLQAAAAVIWFVGISGTYFFAVSLVFLPIGFDFRTLNPMDTPPIITLCCAGSMVLASWVHWWRFQVPMVVAPTFFAVGATLSVLAQMFDPTVREMLSSVIQALSGMIAIALAFYADMTDVHRRHIRARVAFWLHMVGGTFFPQAMIGILLLQNSSTLQLAICAAILVTLLIVIGLLADRKWYIPFAATWVFGGLARVLPEQPIIAVVTAGLVAGALWFGWARLRTTILAAMPLSVQAQLPRLSSQRSVCT